MLRLISISIALLATLAAQAQTQPFAPAGAKWWYNWSHGGHPATPSHDYYTIIAEKDTLVDGNLCSKIITPLGYEFMARDSHRVYIYDGTKWYTLLDFSLQAGDTLNFDDDTIRTISGIPMQAFNNMPIRLIVDSVGVVIMAGRQQRVLYTRKIIDVSEWMFWISYEFIGEGYNFFGQWIYFDLGYAYSYFLRCYVDSIGSYIPPPFDVNGCDWRQILGMEGRSLSTLSVSPNPASGPLLVTLPENLTTAATLVLYNPLGQQVQRTPTVPGQAQRLLSLHSLPSSMYFLTLEGPAGVLARAKLVKE